jgi:type 1 glutamine amidotransferase/glyoxylase-like metal-dependent hydrolase (beta-lactamase superfamily II)
MLTAWFLVYVAMFGAPRPATQVLAAEAISSQRAVYGEWRIRVKPDKVGQYNDLIQSRGLPLFRGAGGRMVGWWSTLVGDLYEQITIWQYDSMGAFQGAVQQLSGDERFGDFAAKRDPLLAGEVSRFMTLATQGIRPALPERAKFIVHETHQVPLTRMEPYLAFMTTRGLKLLQDHGFRLVGPFASDVGRWRDVTYLFCFESLAERDQLRDALARHPDGKTYGEAIHKFAQQIETRLLMPAAFAYDPVEPDQGRGGAVSLVPHVDSLAPGVFAAGFADRFRSANCGWVTVGESTLLVDLPRGVDVDRFVEELEMSGGKPVKHLALTHWQPGDELLVEQLVQRGVKRIFTSPVLRERILSASEQLKAGIQTFEARNLLELDGLRVDLIPADGVAADAGAAVYLPHAGILFAGPLACHGPRTQLAGSRTDQWVATLRQLEQLVPARVVPAFGSWGGREVLERQRRVLTELRRQVGYIVAQGRPETVLAQQVLIPADYLVWMPYDTPTLEDLKYVYREMTVPLAPYQGSEPDAADPRAHALVLIGDQPHEPGHIEEGLRGMFEATGVIPHFTVDVRSLSAENLSKVELFVILRDGIQRPTDEPATHFAWMTDEQQQALVQYIHDGGAMLNLHNSLGLYPDDGAYLQLVGGRYTGHGPLERFRVEVVDADHPITRGVRNFSVADEQHTPVYDAKAVHLLLQNRSDDGKVMAAAGWTREPGRGRICHLANGHTRESLLHPMYQRLLRNAVEWCLRRGE